LTEVFVNDRVYQGFKERHNLGWTVSKSRAPKGHVGSIPTSGTISFHEGATNMKKRLLQVVVEQDEDGAYVASCLTLEGCYTQGDTYEEAMSNIKDVIQMCLEEMKEGKKKLELKHSEVIGLKWIEVMI
jgi:predicted RNase H-like HicB family nuclease